MQEEKNRIERVLGAISQPELIQKVLTFALSVSSLLLGYSLGNFPLHSFSFRAQPAGILLLGQALCRAFGALGKFQVEENLSQLGPN